MIIVNIAWFLWVIRYQIWNRATIGLFFLIFLFKFIAEYTSGLLGYIYIIITARLVLLQYACKDYAMRAGYLDNARKMLKEEITQFLDFREICFVDINADWCVTR